MGARLSIAGSLAALAIGAIGAIAANAVELSIEDGLISVEAENVAVQDILDALAKQHGLRLVQQAEINRAVNVSADRVTVPRLLDSVLELSDSYQLFLPDSTQRSENNANVPPILWIFTEGTGDDYAISFFETVLLRGDFGDRREVIRNLKDLATPSAVNTLSFALSDADARIRNAAVEALADIGSDSALAALASMTADDDPAIRARAAESMGRADNGSANAYLDAALADPDPRVRMAATEGLADLDNNASRQQLASALEDSDPAVRQRALEILEELDEEAMFHALFPAE